jgi:hypothetical protein
MVRQDQWLNKKGFFFTLWRSKTVKTQGRYGLPFKEVELDPGCAWILENQATWSDLIPALPFTK